MRYGMVAATTAALLALTGLIAGCEPPPTLPTEPDQAPAGAVLSGETPSVPASSEAPSLPAPPNEAPRIAPPPFVPPSPEPMVHVGVPAGQEVDFPMPGMGASPDPARGLSVEDCHRAAMHAAILVAIYNVTKEVSPVSDRDPIENGYVTTDHFRYAGGLDVRSRIEIVRGRVTKFDIWFVVPPQQEGDQPLKVNVRDFTLTGPVPTAEQLDRILRAAGGHLAVTKVDGPDADGYYTAEVGLIRGKSSPYESPAPPTPPPAPAPTPPPPAPDGPIEPTPSTQPELPAPAEPAAT